LDVKREPHYNQPLCVARRVHLDVQMPKPGDLPDSVVRELSLYYKLESSANSKEFLATLGWSHQYGTPKKIWYVFQSKVRVGYIFLCTHRRLSFLLGNTWWS